MAYDNDRQVVVLFGGADFGSGSYKSMYGDTWEWDGNNWYHKSDSGPSARMFPRMAYDQARGKIILFGGQTHYSGECLNDTWEWDGDTWNYVASTGPEPRAGHTMVYEPNIKHVILFGGGVWGSGRIFNDTWEWNGLEWTEIDISGPSAREFQAMFYDDLIGHIILFGGTNEEIIYGDTWAYMPVGNQPPYSPTLVAPAKNSIIDPGLATFTWENNGDPDRDYVCSWLFVNQWVVSDWLEIISSDVGDSESYITTLAANSSYQWKVCIYDPAHNSDPFYTYSEYWQFSTKPYENSPPNPPTLLNPANSSNVNSGLVTFTWINNGDPDGDSVGSWFYATGPWGQLISYDIGPEGFVVGEEISIDQIIFPGQEWAWTVYIYDPNYNSDPYYSFQEPFWHFAISSK